MGRRQGAAENRTMWVGLAIAIGVGVLAWSCGGLTTLTIRLVEATTEIYGINFYGIDVN